MTHHAHTLLGAYAVDALDSAEARAVEQHLARCAECRDELASLREATAALADANAAAPPTGLRERVLAQAAATAQLAPSTAQPGVDDDGDAGDAEASDADHADGPLAASEAHDADGVRGIADTQGRDSVTGTPRGGELTPERRDNQQSRGGMRRWWPAAAAAVVIAGVGVGVALGLPGDEPSQSSAASMEKDVMMVTSAPDAASMDLDLGAGHVVMSDRMDAYALMGVAAPMPPVEGTEYQVWLVLDDGSKIAGPTFMPDSSGEYMTVAHTDGQDVVAVAITCEPAGGSEEPTSAVVSEVVV